MNQPIRLPLTGRLKSYKKNSLVRKTDPKLERFSYVCWYEHYVSEFYDKMRVLRLNWRNELEEINSRNGELLKVDLVDADKGPGSI